MRRGCAVRAISISFGGFHTTKGFFNEKNKIIIIKDKIEGEKRCTEYKKEMER